MCTRRLPSGLAAQFLIPTNLSFAHPRRGNGILPLGTAAATLAVRSRSSGGNSRSGHTYAYMMPRGRRPLWPKCLYAQCAVHYGFRYA